MRTSEKSIIMVLFHFISRNTISSFSPSRKLFRGLHQQRHHYTPSTQNAYFSIIQNESKNGFGFITGMRMSSSPNAISSKPSKRIQKDAKKVKGRNKNTGGLRALPVVKPSYELIQKSKKISFQIKADTSIKNVRQRVYKHGAEKIDAVMKSLCLPLRDCVDGYKRELRRLHPFERVVAELTAKARQKKDGLTLINILDEVHEGRKEILMAGKDWIAKIKSAQTAREAADLAVEAEERLYELYRELVADSIEGLIQLQKSLRTTPQVRLDTPAVVLVGAPNVGKSSIVRAISSGKPEVNNYPFTTRGMTLGHVEVFWSQSMDTSASSQIVGSNIPESTENKSKNKSTEQSAYSFSQLCQVMDSPGLLVRDDDSTRNEMEALTLAAMQHLPTAVMYVMDLSGGAGDKCSSVEDQLQLRKEVRARFPKRPWIDVLSKSDLGFQEGAYDSLRQIIIESEKQQLQQLEHSEDNDMLPSLILEVSVMEGTGLEKLSDSVLKMLGEVKLVLDAMEAVKAESSQ